MPLLEELQEQLPEVQHLQMQADGYAIWIVWPGEPNPVLLQTLEDYGGVYCAGGTNQNLWFFFNSDVLLAAARLSVWARFNHLSVSMAIFPVRFSVGVDGTKNLIMDQSLWKMEQGDPEHFHVWVHASMQALVDSLPGISFTKDKSILPPKGMPQEIWFRLEADGRLPYQSSMGWYAILRPVGNPIDKAFQAGWREFFTQLEAVLQRNKFRYTVHDFFLMFPLEGLGHFRNWSLDFLRLVDRLKNEASEQYWPSVMAVVDKNGLNFNQDLPQKVGVPWDQLTPDYPHMSIRNALMLGNDFVFHDTFFAPLQHAPDDWVSINLRDNEEGQGGSLPRLVAESLAVGDNTYCYYCGQRSHTPGNCPSRHMSERDQKVWSRVAQMDFSTMASALSDIDTLLANVEDKLSATVEAAADLKKPSGVMLNALFDIDWVVQPRAARFFWRATGKEVPKSPKDLAPADDNQIWGLLDNYPSTDGKQMMSDLQELALRNSKDFRIYSLMGFVSLDAGELDKAQSHWKEAEVLSSHPIIQCWHQLLQARLIEYQGRYTLADISYSQLSKILPAWTELDYRRAVCLVKAGFPALAIGAIKTLVERNGHYFNRAIIDPELERGHVPVRAFLYGLWLAMETVARDETARLQHIRADLPNWFTAESEFSGYISEQLDKILKAAAINNYVAFQMLAMGRAQVEREKSEFIRRESRKMKDTFKEYAERIKKIYEESAWFPFPKVLVDFNKSYNKSVLNMNWATAANFQMPDSFLKAQHLLESEAERLKKLEGRLKFLRIIRDATIFLLSILETFFWIELVGVILIFVILPLILVYGDKIGLDWTASLIAQERWSVQKALFFLVSVIALTVAALRTVVRFESIREKILSKAKSMPSRKKKKQKEKADKAKK